MPRPPALAATAAAMVMTAAGIDRFERRQLRRTQRAMRKQHADALAGLQTPEEASQAALVSVLERRGQTAWPLVATPVTSRILERLSDDDVRAVQVRLAGAEAELYASCDDATRKRLTLNFAAAHGMAPLLARAGLSASMPPTDVHAMARGALAAGGDFYHADLVFDALEHAGLPAREGGTVLDFGASSGRVLRAVAAGRPDLTCIGCDPNAEAVAWASEHLPNADFFVSSLRPPLELADGSVDAAYAVSIWSHFAEAPALAWLAEMRRLLAPGGALVITTHGIDCLTTQLRRGHISPDTAAAAAAAILQGRLHFVDVFGPEGDWGVKDEGWGNAYLSLEWLLTHTGDDWAVRLAWPGALDQVQDLIVLERR